MVLFLALRSNYKMLGVMQEFVIVNNPKWQDQPYLRWLTLFVTSGTLLCCALPILLVTLGFGAVVASLNYNIPGLLFLAEHQSWALG